MSLGGAMGIFSCSHEVRSRVESFLLSFQKEAFGTEKELGFWPQDSLGLNSNLPLRSWRITGN